MEAFVVVLFIFVSFFYLVTGIYTFTALFYFYQARGHFRTISQVAARNLKYNDVFKRYFLVQFFQMFTTIICDMTYTTVLLYEKTYDSLDNGMILGYNCILVISLLPLLAIG